MQVLLLSVSAHITKQLGMAPGGEFRAAYREVWMTIIKVYKQWHCILFNLFPLDSEVWGVPYFFCNTFFVKTWKYIVIRKYACMRLLKTSVRLTDLFIEYYILCTSKWTCEILFWNVSAFLFIGYMTLFCLQVGQNMQFFLLCRLGFLD